MTYREERRGRLGAAAVAALAWRLTERDRQVALACYEHRVLTTEQLRRLHFGSSRRCRIRLEQLYQLRVLDRFRPPKQHGQGSAPYHWVLDEGGAHIAAQALGLERSELHWRHQAAIGLATSAKLTHQLQVNELATRLAEELAEAGGRLGTWWGERRCQAALEGLVAPDGYLQLRLPGQQPVSLLLELDRATEDYERLRQKARRYLKALPRSPLADEEPLLVVTAPTQTRADGIASALANSGLPHRIVVWTPARSPLSALADALALPTAATGGEGKPHKDSSPHIDLAPLPAPDD